MVAIRNTRNLVPNLRARRVLAVVRRESKRYLANQSISLRTSKCCAARRASEEPIGPTVGAGSKLDIAGAAMEHKEMKPSQSLQVSMPMYDLPELQDSTNAILAHLAVLGITTVVDLDARADQEAAAKNLWAAEGLALTQMCGLAWHQRQTSLTCIATPTYKASGCTNCTYLAYICVRSADFAAGIYSSIADLAGARVAVNHQTSYSGCIGLRAAIAALFPESSSGAVERLLHFDEAATVITGSHRASLAAVRRGLADCCSIDCVTFALLRDAAPSELAHLTVIGSTPSAPAPPFVVPRSLPPHLSAALASGLRSLAAAARGDSTAQSTSSTELQSACTALRISDLHVVGDSRWGAEVNEVEAIEGAATARAFAALERAAERVPLNAPAASFFERLDASGYKFRLGSPSSRTTVEAACEQAQPVGWLDRGMLLLWGFNHGEASHCLHQALEIDPSCFMAHWALALCVGVNYNKPSLSRGEQRQALAQVGLARDGARAAAGAAAAAAADFWLEHALIDALEVRLQLPTDGVLPTGVNAGEQVADDSEEEVDGATLAALHCAYERRMRAILHRVVEMGHGGDHARAEVTALFAEAVMTPRAWKLWPRAGDQSELSGLPPPPDPEVAEARQALEAAVPARHPGVAHFHVHLLEAAPKQELHAARASAAMLRSQWPAVGHLLHMASHIDMQRGHYGLAVRSGERAAAADDAYLLERVRSCYYFTYRNHHVHQLCWAAMFDGQLGIASRAAARIVEETPSQILEAHHEFTEPLFALPWHVDMRFGRWEAILQRPPPEPTEAFPVTCATAAWARALASAALGLLAEAEAEQSSFEALLAAVPAECKIHNVSSRASLEVARHVLDGEISYRRGDAQSVDAAFDSLRHAAALEDALPYDEPAGWMTPVRHALGALLVERASHPDVPAVSVAALIAEAEATFHRDLEQHPENLWALTGLLACVRKRSGDGQTETRALEGRVKRASTRADVDVRFACACAGQALCGRSCDQKG